MEGSQNEVAENGSRRKSGRASQKPNRLVDSGDISTLSNGSTKRKRTQGGDATNEDDIDDELSSEPETDSSEGEPDEEEAREKRRTQKRKSTGAKPATKRARTTNGGTTTLAMRPAKPQTKAAKTKQARARPSQAHQSGLYAEVFGRSNDSEQVADIWMKTLDKDNVAAIRDLINFALQCIGCDVKVDNNDIEDLDNVPSKLGDVLEEYGQKRDNDYPLISRLKQYQGFKTVLADFFVAVIKSLHASSVLYDEPAVYDNIHIWVATMSGAAYRAFRHTATVISLSMSTALCSVAQELQSAMSATRTQLETEKKKKTKNQGRLSGISDKLKSDETKLETIDALLRDAFDTVYVHRYRDVDEKVRAECVSALGNWISSYRKMFLEGQYLRYLGWVLSDTNAPTRLEVVRQLKTLFKNQRNVAALRAFTDRFRPRIVEMGARDTDITVRSEAIELLDRLRNAELLEPNDIDTIGRLIFDNEPRIRKAVSKFFVSNIEDLYKDSIGDIDAEQLSEVLPPSKDAEDFFDPIQSWIKLKCLAQTLSSYDTEASPVDGEDSPRNGFVSDNYDSRYMLATQAIYPQMRELEEWESLAGYLLYDHSSIQADPDQSDAKLVAQAAYKLNPVEEPILLDVLYSSVKLYLQSIIEPSAEKKTRRTKANKDEQQQKQEDAAHSLTNIIPQLLNKFGSTPQAATSILRLEQLLDKDLINDLQSGDGTYEEILRDINNQFVSHSDRKVLTEATKALRTARTFEQTREAADQQVAELWQDASSNLRNLLHGKTIDTRSTLDMKTLEQTVTTAARMAHLATISDCSDILETRASSSRKQKGKPHQSDSLLEILLQLVKRGVADDETTPDAATSEDQLCLSATSILSLYFRWRIVALRTSISNNTTTELGIDTLTELAMTRTSFVEALLPVIASRQPLDQTRIASLLTLLDLFTLFATVRHMRPAKGELDEEVAANVASLVTEIPADVKKEVLLTHEKLERSFAKKTGRKIEIVGDKEKTKKAGGRAELGGGEREDDEEEDVERPPEDSDDEDARSDMEDDDDEGEGAGQAHGKNARKQASLLAEQALCEYTGKIVLSVIAGVMGDSGAGVKERVQVNRTKLGKSYNAVVGYLDEKKEKKRGKQGKGEVGTKEKRKEMGIGKGKKAVVTPMVVEGDDIEDDEDDDHDAAEVGEGDDGEEQDAAEQVEAEAENGDDNEPNVHAEDDEIMGD